jgi:hypothetical protein
VGCRPACERVDAVEEGSDLAVPCARGLAVWAKFRLRKRGSASLQVVHRVTRVASHDMVTPEQPTGVIVTRSKVSAAGLAAAALILLTACGGGGSDKGSDKIKGADSGKTGSPAATTSASATPGVQRPKITFPSGVKTMFEGQHTGDPKKDAVLADNARGVDAVYAAILEGKTHTSALEFYNAGRSLESAVSFIQGWVDQGEIWTGNHPVLRSEGHVPE